jgi:hypothetical protein
MAAKQGGEGLLGAQVRSRTLDKRIQHQLPLPKTFQQSGEQTKRTSSSLCSYQQQIK